MRKLDHLVMPLRDLDAASTLYEALGFQLTPRADHAWGTSNRLVQIDGTFLELLTAADPCPQQAVDGDVFSFGAFNQDFLSRHEGISMLVLGSDDPEADRKAFGHAGLATYAPFSFERIAGQPDGSERKVAFDLTFTTHPDVPDAAFFTCRNRFPENFWKPEYQDHPNGALRIGAVIMVADEPAELHEFIEGFSGQRELRSTSFGIECDLGESQIDILSPVGFSAFYGDVFPLDTLDSPRIVAFKINVDDIAKIERLANAAGIEVTKRSGMVIVPASAAHGSVLIFQQVG
jgi:catechol 2,3-dioxygenase-like lactoylglutathione lyase family enzyme